MASTLDGCGACLVISIFLAIFLIQIQTGATVPEPNGFKLAARLHGSSRRSLQTSSGKLWRFAARTKRSGRLPTSIVQTFAILPPTIAPPAPPQDITRKKYGGGKNRSDGVYLLSQLSTLQVTQEWKDHEGESSSEFKAMLPKIMIWSTGIEYPYPTHWSQTEYPPKFVLGYYKKNVIESILLARGTTPEYAPHALTFVVDFIAIDPNKNISTVLPVLEKMRNIGISFRITLQQKKFMEEKLIVFETLLVTTLASITGLCKIRAGSEMDLCIDFKM
eukprot:jgi/Bigna1/91318/estExt_fgenesh1_pg.C_960051